MSSTRSRSRRVLTRDRNFWCEEKVDGAGVLIDADAYFRSFYRAAEKAEHSILLSGWQFDSEVELLRGDDVAERSGATETDLPVTLKAFLDALCERRPKLQIFMLAWDFHVAFALEREWVQELIFNWTTNERFRFLFDSSHVDKGCHHQKFAVIDGQLSFLGGLDLCDHRWDNRQHLDNNPLRTSRGGEPHKPFHDVQVWLEGRDVAQRLTDLFVCRWQLASGNDDEKIDIAIPPDAGTKALASRVGRPSEGMTIPSTHVALSRTDPKGSPTQTSTSDTGDAECREVEHLFVDAIDAAERSIFVETQYFSSLVVGNALVERILATDRSALEIVLVLNMRAETFKEEVAVGLAQAKVLLDIRAAAAAAAKNTTTPHRLGIYYTVPAHDGTEEPERSTYIHSKVMIVDDRLLNIGSANLTNRSGSVDTELNATFEAQTIDGNEPLAKMIAQLRCDLIGEHLGESPSVVAAMKNLVEELDDRARRRDGRLRLHPSPTENEDKVLSVIDPQGLPFDPHGVEDDVESRSLFVHGVGALFRRLLSDRDDTK